MDSMASFHVGFPRMISKSCSDTAEPRNLHDWELSDDTEELPTSRVIAEATPVTYLIVKGCFLNTLSRVTDFNSDLHLGSYDTVVDIDRALQHELDSIPSHMNVILDNSNIIPRAPSDFLWYPNLQLVAYYHVGMCNLHKQFMVRVREDERFRLSRERCVSSAVSLMSFQWDLHPSFYHYASARQTFALAPMLLFLELELRKKDTNKTSLPESAYLLQILEQAVARWEEATRFCDETRKIYHLLRRMLAGYQASSNEPSGSLQATLPEEIFEENFPGLSFDTFDGGPLFDSGATDTTFDWVSGLVST
jgi:hypothetical protein